MSADKSSIKEQLTNELGDRLRALEMDVTNSFLTGKICSPMLGAANNMGTAVLSTGTSAVNMAAAKGLYITKDGLQFDPTVMTDAVFQVVNSSIMLAGSELLQLRDTAWRELTYIPDPSIITNKAISYFSYELKTNLLNIEDMLNFSNIDEQIEEHEQSRITQVYNKVNDWVSEKLPPITDKINDIANNITTYTTYAMQYASFGPEWVSDKVAGFIEDGVNIADEFLDEQVQAFNTWKLDMYDRAGTALGKFMCKEYEKLVKQNLKEVNDQIEVNKSKAKIQATALLHKANLAIMSKTGVKIPIESITPENLEKIKRSKKISELLSLAASANDSSQPEDSGEKPADETTTVESAPERNTDEIDLTEA